MVPGSEPSRRFASLVLIVGMSSVSAGCASWNSTGSHTPLAGRLWHRSEKPDREAGYDLYADRMAGAAPRDTTRAALAAGEESPGGERHTGAPSAKAAAADIAEVKVARADSSRRGENLRERTPKRTDDSAIRVTLGRPESLPTLNDGGAAPGAMLASSTNWRRRGERPSARTAGESDQRTQWRKDETTRDAVDDRAPDTRVADGSQRAAKTAAPPRRAGGADETRRSASSDDPLRALLARARARLETMSTYQVDITRVERVGNQVQPEEDVVLSIRRNPKAVRLEWPRGPSKGREVLYSAAVNPRTMFVNMTNSSLPIPRMSFPIDSPLVLRSSRHPITEAGFDTILEGLEKHGAADAAGIQKDGRLVYKGVERPKGLDLPCHLLQRTTSEGETWQVYLDSRSLMPAVAVAFRAGDGELIERYSYRNLRPNPAELASADAFDPDKRWGEPKGLLSRLARGAVSPSDARSGSTATR
jgi:hypothetical protein